MNVPVSYKQVGLAIGLLALTAPSWSAQWVTNITPTQVITANTGGAYTQILTAEAITNPAACIADSYIVRDPAIANSALATALAALAAGRQIRVWVTDTCDATLGRPIITAVGMM